MNDMIINAAQDPSCILAVTPDRGGSWWAALRPATPRNFAENPMTWTNAKTALDTIDQSHDFTFEIEFKCVKTNAAYVFASDGLRDFIRVFLSNGTVIVNTALLGTSSGGSTQFSAGSDSIHRHILTVKFTGNTITASVDSEAIYTRENLFRNVIEIGTPRSNAGYVYKISLTDDTTGETIWQASHDELYETNNPWPSATLRNFAEEPMTWTEFSPDKITINTQHDYEFLIQFSSNGQLPPTDNETQLFYSTDNKMLAGVWIAKDGQIRGYLSVYEYNALMIHEIGEPALSAGIHTIRILAVGNTMSAYLDDELVNSAVRNRRTDFSEITSYPISSFDGNLLCAKLTDLTTGRTVWSYPSEAERVRLITKTNVRTDRGVFEAADETKISGISTMLDLRGNTTSKTFVARAFCPAHDPASEKLYIHPFFGQGQISSGATAFTFQFSLWEDCRSGKSSQLFPAISTGTDMPGANITGVDGYLNQWHTYAMVVDYTGGNCYIRVFVDGTMLRERIVSGTPTWNTPAAATAQETTVGVRRDPNASYYAGSLTRVSSALVFDRALTAAEIAALCPTSN